MTTEYADKQKAVACATVLNDDAADEDIYIVTPKGEKYVICVYSPGGDYYGDL